MKKILLFSKLILLGISTQAQEKFIVKDEAFWTIVPRNVAIEKIATGFLFTEGPVWNKEGNFLLFSDIPANTIYKLTENGKYESFKNPSFYSNGLTYDSKGNFVAAEHQTKRITSTDKSGKTTVLIDRFEGKKFNSPNDLVFKKNGTFYFTDPPYGHFDLNRDAPMDLSFSGVYCFKNQKLILIDSSMVRPNGIALSPDERTLYVAQSEFKWLWKSYELDEEGSVLSSKIFFEGSGIYGNPDGVKVDQEGNVYCTGNHGVMIFNKAGKLLGTITLPENGANLAWGDKNFQSIYVTAQKSIYRIKLLKKGAGQF